MIDWLEIRRGPAPLIVSFPHTGTDIPPDIEDRFVSSWLARKDADWWVDRLYDFAADLGATTVRTRLSRSVIDVNRDPSGASLYPGQATTDLCPLTTFDGQPLYRDDGPDEDEIARRRDQYFEPYHSSIEAEIERLRKAHPRVVLYDAHSIRSAIPRLFDGDLPVFNIGTNGGTTCDEALSNAVEKLCANSGFSHVVNGRFKGGWTTRRYGRPAAGVHAIQMELACRSYMTEPAIVSETNWPSPWSPQEAAEMRSALTLILELCLAYGRA